MVSGVGRGMGALDGVVIVEGDEAVLGVNLGCPLVPMGTLLRGFFQSTFYQDLF